MPRGLAYIITPARLSPPELSHSAVSVPSPDENAPRNKGKGKNKAEFHIECLEVASNSTISVRNDEPEPEVPLRLEREPIAPVRNTLLRPRHIHPLLAPPSKAGKNPLGSRSSSSSGPAPAAPAPVRSVQAAKGYKPLPPPGPPPAIAPPPAPVGPGRRCRPRILDVDPSKPACTERNCKMPQTLRSLYCKNHTCWARNVDGELCPNKSAQYGSEKFPTFCENGYHVQTGRFHMLQVLIANRQRLNIFDQIKYNVEAEMVQLEKIKELQQQIATHWITHSIPAYDNLDEEVKIARHGKGPIHFDRISPASFLPTKSNYEIDVDRIMRATSSSLPVEANYCRLDDPVFHMPIPDCILHLRSPPSVTGKVRLTLAEKLAKQSAPVAHDLRGEGLPRTA